MEMDEEILLQIEEIFRDLLDNEAINLNNKTTADDIDEWNSLSHIQLVVAVEKHFRIKFHSREILSWKNVGEMVHSVKNKLIA